METISGNSLWSSSVFSYLTVFFHWPAPGKTSPQSHLFLLPILSGTLVCFPLGIITSTRISVWAPYIPILIPTPQTSSRLQSALECSQACSCSSLGQLSEPWTQTLQGRVLSISIYGMESTEIHNRVKLSQLTSTQCELVGESYCAQQGLWVIQHLAQANSNTWSG